MKRALALIACLGAVAVAGASTARPDTCPTSNPPNELKVVAGTGQTAQLEHQFQTSLHVALANSNGCDVTGQLGGVFVHFIAPSSGASGVFASTGTNAVGVETDASGDAVAPAFTANDTTGGYGVLAESSYGTVQLSLWNTDSGVPATIAATEGDGQSATAGTAYSEPLQARVVDANGNPVQGATVTFAVGVGANGASASFAGGGAQASIVTNSVGLATTPAVVANASSGPFTATASIAGARTVATFALDNHSTTVELQPVATARRRGTVGRGYPQPLEAKLLDSAGQPVEGATVTFSIVAAGNGAGASFLSGSAQATSLTGSTGLAISPVLVANKTAGAFTATVSATGASPISVALTNLASTPYRITVGAASGTSTAVGTRFDVPLAVTVVDVNGNPVAGAIVVFTAPTRGATGRFPHGARLARVRTDADGIAVAPPFVASRTAGGFAVVAGVAGTSRSAAFALVVMPRE